MVTEARRATWGLKGTGFLRAFGGGQCREAAARRVPGHFRREAIHRVRQWPIHASPVPPQGGTSLHSAPSESRGREGAAEESGVLARRQRVERGRRTGSFFRVAAAALRTAAIPFSLRTRWALARSLTLITASTPRLLPSRAKEQ